MSADRVEEAIRGADGPALCAYLMAGYPDAATFARQLVDVSQVADVVEVGVPFSDPIADGRTIQQAGFEALAGGTSLGLILDLIAGIGDGLGAPCLLMGYYNPFLAHGLDRLAGDLAAAAIAGLIVPDLPLEDDPLRDREVHLEVLDAEELLPPIGRCGGPARHRLGRHQPFPPVTSTQHAIVWPGSAGSSDGFSSTQRSTL